MRNWFIVAVLLATASVLAQPAPRPDDRPGGLQPPPHGPGPRPDGQRPELPPGERGSPDHRPDGPPPWIGGPERDVMWIGLFRPDLQQRLMGLRRSPDQFGPLVERLRGRVAQVIPGLLTDLEKEISAVEQSVGAQPPAAEAGPPNGPLPGPGGHHPDGPPGKPGDHQGRMGPPPGERGGARLGMEPNPDGRTRPADSPEVEKLRGRNGELERAIADLAPKAGANADAAAALKQALGEQFDVRSRLRQLELERVGARIAELQETLKMLQDQQERLTTQRNEHSQRRSEIIERRMQELTRPNPR